MVEQVVVSSEEESLDTFDHPRGRETARDEDEREAELERDTFADRERYERERQR